MVGSSPAGGADLDQDVKRERQTEPGPGSSPSMIFTHLQR